MKTETFEVNGYQATVLLPENPNGKWVWKTEFFYAFDQAERALFDLGYTRVYYQISDKFGSPTAVRLMRAFHDELLKRYPFLEEKANLFGFSRGGLYAFNYALYYPERVKKLYLDAPVLNLKSWPHNGSEDQALFFKEYNLNAQSFESFCDSPIDHLDEFAKIAPPVLLVAGGKDEVVPFEENGKLLYEKLKNQGGKIELYLKENCGHHPHSLENVAPVVEFTEK